jgi:hypothetical protein
VPIWRDHVAPPGPRYGRAFGTIRRSGCSALQTAEELVQRGTKRDGRPRTFGVVNEANENHVRFLCCIDGSHGVRSQFPTKECRKFEVTLNQFLASVGVACTRPQEEIALILWTNERHRSDVSQILEKAFVTSHGPP